MSAAPPVSTYRLQLHAGFGFDAAAGVVDYLAGLGVTHVYCSPYLQAAPGSPHGYDVVDHARLSEDLGGDAGFARLVAACRQHGLGIIADIVPNHMSVGAPESQNAAWWDVLRAGPASPYAHWFDIEWDSRDNPGKVVLPILGGPLGDCLPDLAVDGDRLRYHDHELPLAEGSLVPGDLAATLDGQHYRLCDWRVGSEELTHRRFFDVTTLAGIRVELPDVFAATHEIPLRQLAGGEVSGLRVDHPDGLADPGGYLARLQAASGGGWVVAEKILEPGEQLPDSWPCAGTTGYDALNRVTGLFVDPAGEAPLTALWESLTGSVASFGDVARVAKRDVLDAVLAPEVDRLTELAVAACRPDLTLRDLPRRRLREALVELLVSFPVYRAYLPPRGPAGPVAREQVRTALADASSRRPDRARELAAVACLALGEGPPSPAAEELVTRFQQTCGPVMAKGVEDTAFYRYLRLVALNEVGGDPGRFGTPVADFHAFCAEQADRWPRGMTALSTHDTKRSEDVRVRLALLSQCPTAWGEAVVRWGAAAAHYRTAAGPDPAMELLVWQTLVGAWPLPEDRLLDHLRKAAREAKAHTSWLAPHEGYEAAVAGFARRVCADPQLAEDIAGFVAGLEQPWRVAVAAQKLVQLTMPGVADCYQGTEDVDLSLVDPDNRRPVDFAARRRDLAALDAAAEPGGSKLAVVRAALRLRREHPDWFLAGGYTPLETGPGAVGFLRGDSVAVVATVRPVPVLRSGWGAATAQLPPGRWRDRLSGRLAGGGVLPLADLLADGPGALLVREPA